MKARKRFGQHFLTDEAVLGRITSACRIQAPDVVVEIGPGHGALTQHLVGAAPKQLVAIEIDRDLAPLLAARYPDLSVINADVLQVDFDEISAQYGDALHVVGNLPYNISTPLLLKLAAWSRGNRSALRDGLFMVQRELGERLAAVPGNKSWGRLSVMTQLAFDIEYLFDVAPESFKPPPKVWSSVIRLQPTTKWSAIDGDLVKKIDQICRLAFAGRRKKLSNALKTLDLDWSQLNLDPQCRADDVRLEDFVSLAQYVTYDGI